VTQRLRVGRTAALATLALVLLTMGVTARGASSSLAKDPVDALTLKQQVGQLIVLSFSGTTAPA
jgi:hypothetical protein